jgi:hypothetical protein
LLLLPAILFGFIARLITARVKKITYEPILLRSMGLVVAAMIPQLSVFGSPSARFEIPLRFAAVVLVGSQVLLLVFVWLNRQVSGFTILGIGFICNFLVIVLNGGLMPISPETATALISGTDPQAWEIGSRFGLTKDIILPRSETTLWWLSDVILLPSFFPVRAAFSVGDVLIAVGAFWSLWRQGGPKKEIGLLKFLPGGGNI